MQGVRFLFEVMDSILYSRFYDSPSKCPFWNVGFHLLCNILTPNLTLRLRLNARQLLRTKCNNIVTVGGSSLHPGSQKV